MVVLVWGVLEHGGFGFGGLFHFGNPIEVGFHKFDDCVHRIQRACKFRAERLYSGELLRYGVIGEWVTNILEFRSWIDYEIVEFYGDRVHWKRVGDNSSWWEDEWILFDFEWIGWYLYISFKRVQKKKNYLFIFMKRNVLE